MNLDRDALEQLDRPALIELVLTYQARISALEAQVARLLGLGDDPEAPPSVPAPSPPPVVATSAHPPRAAKRPRKRRLLNFARQREAPTQVIEHTLDACPGCGTPLGGGEVVRRRQILHVPRVPVAVIEHVVRQRTCPGCGRRCAPGLDLSDQALGQHRVSLPTMAYIASLRTSGRLPVRTIQWLLESWHGLHLSVGALVGILEAVAQRATPALRQLQEAVRASPVVCADETGWREDGQAGYVWVFATPTHRSFHYNRSRAGAVVQAHLGAVYEGTLVSDFYAAYNVHAGPHQRCWVHLLRDIHDLRLAHPDDPEVAAWATAVRDLYVEAKPVAASALTWPARVAARARLDSALFELCRPGLATDTTLPQATLCHRIDRFLDELFEFVLDPSIPADNNLAERSLRPLVIARKVSGGTRAEGGSATRMALASLFGTWLAQGRDPFDACQQMLLTQSL